MKYSYQELKSTFISEFESIYETHEYSFSFEEGLEIFFKTIIYQTGDREIDGLEIKIIPTLDKYFHYKKDKNDSLNYFTQLATKLDTYLQKITFITDNDTYIDLKSRNKGMYFYVGATGINKNDIDFRTPISQINGNLLDVNFGKELYSAYEHRNIEAHTAIEYLEAEIPNFINDTLIIYLFATFEKYAELKEIVNDVEIEEYLVINEITKELTPIGEYLISPGDIISRNDEIEELNNESYTKEKIILITGIGGIGKSTIIKGYIKSFNSTFNHIVWISMNGNLLNSINQCISLIGNLNLQIPDNISESEKFELIMRTIGKLSGNNLLVLDNYIEGDTNNSYSKLPFCSNWKIIATSRMVLNDSKYYIIPTDTLNFNDSKTLFSKYYTGEINDSIFNDLLKTIDSHTLTIELLAKTLETNFTINGIEELLDHLNTSILANEDWQVELEVNYSQTELNLRNHLLNTFDISELNEYEKEILLYFSLLPIEVFNGSQLIKIFNVKSNKISLFINTLNSLNRKGWINKINNTFSSHSIIQEVIKIKIPSNIENSSNIIEGLNLILEINDNLSIIEKQKYLSSAENLVKLIPTECEEICILNHLISITHKDLGNYLKAIEYGSSALEISKGSVSINFQWAIYSNLAVAYRRFGDLDNSFKFYDEAIKIIENTENKDITMISVYTNLATLHDQIGNQENLIQAKSLYKYVINELTLFSQENNEDFEFQIAHNKGSLGKVYNLLSKYDTAISLQLSAYNSILDILGPSNFPLSIHANNLGLSYAGKKEFDNSLKYHQIAVNIQKEILPDEHPELSVSLSGLANAFKNLGNTNKAKELFEEVLEIGLKTLPVDHPALARRKANLAVVCKIPEELVRAKSLYNEAIEIETKHYGENNPNVAISIYSLGILNLEVEKYDDALINFKKAYSILFSNYGSDHEFTKKTLFWILEIQKM